MDEVRIAHPDYRLPRKKILVTALTMRIIQISDSHISRKHPARTVDLQTCIQHINAAEPQPDIVVHTGDITHHGRAEEYEIARRLLDNLSAPYFVLAGNRDNRHGLIKVFADGRHIRFGMDFVQYSVEHFDARLILIDTVSEYSNKGRLCQARLAHIEHMLATDTSRPAVLFLHHPPFEVNVVPDPFQFEEWADVKALMAQLGKHHQICGVFCGHVHRNVEGAIGAVRASAVSCVAFDLRKGSAIASNRDLPIFNTHCIQSRAPILSGSLKESIR